MSNAVIVYVLNVGQGMGNFVEIYGNGVGNPPTKTFLYDFGSEKGFSRYGVKSVDFVMGRLKTMATPKLDLIIFSHGDKDHWNLFTKFILRCNTDPVLKNLQYGQVYFGGSKDQYDFAKGTYNILSILQAKGAKVGSGFEFHGSNFKGSAPWSGVNLDGLYVRLLLANVDNGAYKNVFTGNIIFSNKNSVSAVVVCEYAGVRFLFPGDATGETFHSINAWIVAQKIEKQVDNTFMLVLPHHGSKVTLSYGKPDPYLDARNFAAFCKANSITASADFRKGFNHPDLSVINLFAPGGSGSYTPPVGEAAHPKHLLTAYDLNNWYTYNTLSNIYTTAYSTSSRVNSWSFGVRDDAALFTWRDPSNTPLKAVSHATRVADMLAQSFLQTSRAENDSITPVNTSNASPVYKALRKKRAPGSDVGMYPEKQ
ncbi:MAG TPA: hypothetical protein VLM37_05570 [Fibrobacteraceae bacterium]|nr:hypothetical protein [Fibrobacteraceae bacterium]